MAKQPPNIPPANSAAVPPPPPARVAPSPEDVAWATKYGQGGKKASAPTSSAPSAAPAKSRDSLVIDAATDAADTGKRVPDNALRIR